MRSAPRVRPRRLAPFSVALLAATRLAWGQAEPPPRYLPRLWLPPSQGAPAHGEGVAPERAEARPTSAPAAPAAPPLPHGGGSEPAAVARGTLSPQELEAAKSAWGYFPRNRRSTGLVDGVQGYGYVTAWDIGSTLAGLASAERLGVIDRAELDAWLETLLATLRALPLYNDELPNREYDTRGARMVDLANRPSVRGSGWSALDLGRLLLWLRIVARWYPQHADSVRAVVARWRFERLATDGVMHGTLVRGSGEDLRQEGRLGYEQYAAAGFALWGLELAGAFARDHVAEVEVAGVRLRHDTRNLAFLTSDPFILGLIEVGGIDREFEAQAAALYAAQKSRWHATGALTAVGEDTIDAPPWFVYHTVWLDGEAWRCTGHDGRAAPERRSLSTKAAFGWWAVFPDDYSERLLAAVRPALATAGGYQAGLYESGRPNRSLNVNTNAVLLESLLYVQRGRQAFVPWRR